jgi:hypothetical protein
MKIEEDAPISNSSSETFQPAMKFPHVALEWIVLHRVNRSEDPCPITERDSLK